ncbi:nucleolar MIF4G domain-containing protein 1 homolog [Choristoneura fumiferana]|uniref:nucleolar MIF4G domain-containing protein 1 homolog n=1 Tax=Choristoneura fumiferana TaxID=7141 RepID=UPI003D15D73E
MKKTKQAARANFPNTRKALRKQKRQQKKVHRQEHYLKKKTLKGQPQYVAGRFVKRPADAPEPIVEVKKKKPKSQPMVLDVIERERQKEKKEADRLKAEMEEQRRKTFLEANEEEDKMIKKLEKQLGLNKVKNKKNFFSEDGLDYLLEICDRSTTEQIVAAEKHLANVEGESDFEEDLAAVTGKKLKKESKNIDTDDEDMDEEMNDYDGDSKMEEDASDMDSDDEEGEDMDDFGTGDEVDSEDNDKSSGDEGNSYVSDDEPEEKPAKTLKPKPKEKVKKVPDTEKKTKEKVVTEEELSKMFSDDEVLHLSDDEDLDGCDDEFDEDSENQRGVKSEEKPDVWEDIYGRKRDKEGNVIKEEKGIYIPPHLRNKDSTSDQAMIQLKRQIKSILNKLTHTNLHWACTSIETLYSSNSRHSVNSALFSLWLEAVGGTEAAPSRLASTHAALVAVLHANVATEIGAHFLEELCMIFDSLMQRPQPMEDKKLDNIVCCLAHLYSFKIYHATLLFDVLNRLLLDLTEKHMDCILAVFRCAGAALRKDSPASLKLFVQQAQTAAAGIGDADTGSRIKFLLEVLMAVKNNNLNKIPNYDPTFVEQLKKDIRGVIRKGNYVTPLNITLEDLLKADTRGKWWVVGSAWEGNRPRLEEKAKVVPSTDQKLLELARKQRMNTDVRRSIFCVIMAAEVC